MKKILGFLLFITWHTNFAQEITVQGKVTDSLRNILIMKKLVLILGMVFATSFSSVNATHLQQKVNNKTQDIARICRYYAITEANGFGNPYGSQAWQEVYLSYYRDCIAELK